MKILVFLLSCLCSCGVLYAAAGDLDSTFDGDGKVTTDFAAGADRVTGIVLQPDGKIVAVGRVEIGGSSDFGVARYNPDGSLDSGFGAGGKRNTDFGSGDIGEAVALQADGKIVVVGSTSAGTQGFAVARYLPNGNLDTSFSSDGKVTTDFSADTDSAKAVAIQPDGKIVVAGYAGNAGISDVALVRYNADGSLDTSFSFDGKIVLDFGPDSVATAVALQPDGRIVVAGNTYNPDDFAVARYNPDGSPDTSFDSDGRLTTDFPAGLEYGNSVALQADGKIIVGGGANPGSTTDFALLRYNPDGSLDTTFNFDGKVSVDLGGNSDTFQSVVVQPDGKIVAAGYTQGGGVTDFAVVRFTSDGSLDTSFSTDGIVTTDFFTDNDVAYGAAVQPDGKILAAGWAHIGTNREFALARYEGDPLPACVFCDDFEDGVLASDWTYVKPSWSESGGNLIATPVKKAAAIASPAFAGCSACSFEASMMTSGGSGNRLWMLAWYADKNNTLEILMKEESGKFILKQRAGGAVVAKTKGLIPLLPNVSYNVKVTFDGAAFTLFVNGNSIATLTAAAAPSVGTVGFQAKNTTASFGHVLVE